MSKSDAAGDTAATTDAAEDASSDQIDTHPVSFDIPDVDGITAVLQTLAERTDLRHQHEDAGEQGWDSAGDSYFLDTTYTVSGDIGGNSISAELEITEAQNRYELRLTPESFVSQRHLSTVVEDGITDYRATCGVYESETYGVEPEMLLAIEKCLARHDNITYTALPHEGEERWRRKQVEELDNTDTVPTDGYESPLIDGVFLVDLDSISHDADYPDQSCEAAIYIEEGNHRTGPYQLTVASEHAAARDWLTGQIDRVKDR